MGFYESRCEILAEMHKVMSDIISEIQSIGFTSTHPHLRAISIHSPPKFSVDNGIVTLDMVNSKKKTNADGTLEWKYFVINPADYIESSLMPVLGYCNKETTMLSKLEVDDMRFTNSSTAGFLYSNIVGNTMIDQTQSRLLATIPMRSKAGYNYFEFQNPSYRLLSVHSITDITFVITDVEGSVFKMDNVHLRRRNFTGSILPTILNLHIRKQL